MVENSGRSVNPLVKLVLVSAVPGTIIVAIASTSFYFLPALAIAVWGIALIIAYVVGSREEA